MDAFNAIVALRDELRAAAKDDHARETVQRAWEYALSRVYEGSAKTEQEAKLAFAAFADGFCTGVHQANGTVCSRS